MKKVAVLMAGGKSERLWPYSREHMPKQFLSILGDGETMIQKTVNRILPIITYEDIYIVTNVAYAQLVKDQLPLLPVGNILSEPVARNTAPCIGYAAAVLNVKYDDAMMFVLSADHMITQEDAFRKDLMTAADFADRNDAIVTIGVTPATPETGYGYINIDRAAFMDCGLYPVKQFVEKPPLDTAMEYVSSGEYLWNSGMFIWRLSLITEYFRTLLPRVHMGMQLLEKAYVQGNLSQVLEDVFAYFPSISIDCGIMEHAKNIFAVPSSFTWLDIGNWNAMADVYKTDKNNNSLLGDVMMIDTTNTIVSGQHKRLIALINVDNLVVVDTDDTLMICHRDHLNKVKEMLTQVHKAQRMEGF